MYACKFNVTVPMLRIALFYHEYFTQIIIIGAYFRIVRNGIQTALLENIEELKVLQSSSKEEGIYAKNFIIRLARAIDKMRRWCIARDFYRLSVPTVFGDDDTPTGDYFAQYM